MSFFCPICPRLSSRICITNTLLITIREFPPPHCPTSLPHRCSYPPHLSPPPPPVSLLVTRHRLFCTHDLITRDCAHVFLFLGWDAVTRLRNNFFIASSLRQLYFATLRGDCQTISPLVQSCVHSAEMGYHLQHAVIDVVLSASY